MLGRCRAEVAARVLYFGQGVARPPEEFQQVFVPRALADVVQHGARRVGMIGRECPTLREPVDQPRVDRDEPDVAVLGALAQSFHVLEQPLDLRRGEIGIEHETGARAYERALLLLFELRAARRGASILPDDRAVDGAAALALPGAHRLALVRDPNGVGCYAGLADRFPRRLDRDAQDFLGVVLDLARRWEVLRELTIAAAEHAACVAQDKRG